jgi:hypothetical protein
MKVVINACFGGFSLSHEAFRRLRELQNEAALKEADYGEKYDDGSGPREKTCLDRNGMFGRDIPRNDPQLVQVVEELGAKANGGCAELKVVEIPDDVEWEIDEYDGYEKVAEVHRTWG